MSGGQEAAPPRSRIRAPGSLPGLVATSLGALLLLFLLGLLLISTPQGSAWLVGEISALAGGRLTVTGVRGTLVAGLSVERLRLSAGRTTIEMAPAELRVRWPDLLRRQLRLTTAHAETVTVEVGPRPPDQPVTPVEPLLLPVAIRVDGLEVDRLLISTGGTPAEIGPVRLDGALVDGEIRVRALTATLYGVTANASGTFFTGEPFPVRAKLAWQAPPAGVSGAGTLGGDLSRLRFEQVVRVPDPVGVGGVLRLLQPSPEIVAEARWTGLHRPLGPDPGSAVLSSDAGRLAVRGWTDAIALELDADAGLFDWPRAAVSVRASGTLRELDLTRIAVAGFGGQTTGTGRLQLTDALHGSLDLAARQIDPGFLDPRLTGRVDFRAGVQFASDGNFVVSVPEASGRVFQRPLRASGTVARESGSYRLDRVRIVAGDNRVDINGTWGDTLKGSFQVDAPDLATLWPGLGGTIRGSGVVGGTLERPVLDVSVDGEVLSGGELRLRSLRVRGGLGARDRVNLDLDARGLVWAGRPVGDLAVAGSGRLPDHALQADLTGGDVAVHLRADGSWNRGVLRETFGDGRVTLPGDQLWTLRDPATVRLAGSEVQVTGHCWTHREAELCVSDSHSDARGMAGGLTLREFPLAALASWLPADVRLGGAADAAVEVQRTAGRLTGSARASLRDALVTWKVPDDEDLETAISEFRVSAELTDDTLVFQGVVAESYGLRLVTAGTVIEPFGASPLIAAKLTGGVPDLASVAPLLERFVDVGDVQGRIDVDTTVTGNARRPDILGGLQLEDGAFSVPVAGIKVDRVSLALAGREDGRLHLQGAARSGKGFLALDGNLAWRDQLVPSAEATVKGRVIDVIRLPEGLVQVSPDVEIRLRNGQFRVSGDVLVPRAEIKLKKIEEGAVEPSPDVVVHGRDLAEATRPPPLFVLDALRVRLGSKVKFEGFGLNTGLTGGVTLSQSVAADPTLISGDGVVSLRDGKFAAFGQKLDIDRGSLIFAGVVTDPGIDVKASRDVDYEGREVTVGVLLSGTISRIQTKVFSEPAMGEMDALSYLTTGKPLSAAGSGDRFSVSNAAISLGMTQALPVVQDLGSALRVDEIGLDTSEAGGTAVVVGEQLGKDLFIRYTYGVFDKIGTVKATYKIGRHVSIEGSSGSEQALDLIYSVNW